jgi:L-ascorbate metabolism protein UlaG (beta-lactamase superfamily)
VQVTKYNQSTLVLEGEGRIAIDIGTLTTAAYDLDELGHLDAVLFTHRHGDHLDPDLVPRLEEAGVAIYGNADVCSLLGEAAVQVSSGEAFEVAGFQVEPRDLEHVELVDGSPGPPNTGFVIDGRLFHPGDGISLAGLTVEALAVPIAGPSISARDAYRFIQQVSASTAIPIHYDVFTEDAELVAGFLEDLADIRVLEPGASTEL